MERPSGEHLAELLNLHDDSPKEVVLFAIVNLFRAIVREEIQPLLQGEQRIMDTTSNTDAVNTKIQAALEDINSKFDIAISALTTASQSSDAAAASEAQTALALITNVQTHIDTVSAGIAQLQPVTPPTTATPTPVDTNPVTPITSNIPVAPAPVATDSSAVPQADAPSAATPQNTLGLDN